MTLLTQEMQLEHKMVRENVNLIIKYKGKKQTKPPKLNEIKAQFDWWCVSSNILKYYTSHVHLVRQHPKTEN